MVGQVSRVVDSATTYALRFADTDLWKIGYSSNVDTRLLAVNRHISVEIIPASWAVARRSRWGSQLAAYAMEQEVLALLASERTAFERVRCTPERLASPGTGRAQQ